MPTLGFHTARHLLSRTGFGARLADVERFADLSPDAAVDALFDGVRATPTTAMPDWIDDEPPSLIARRLNRRELRMRAREMGRELKAWWLGEMLATPSPLTERMTLFWANHFTSSLRKVPWPPLMARQNQLLRTHALGRFDEMLRAIVRDPAMLIYLDNARSHRDAPNENLARELFELFTLGEGEGYTEDDIKEAARALTGYGVDRRTATFQFVRRRHDDGEKTILGETGRFDGDDLVDLILAQPRTARHIAGLLWSELVSAPPDDRMLERVARALRDADYAIEPALRTILTSDAFLAPAERGRMVRAPVHLVVGTLRGLGVQPPDVAPLVRFCRGLGQDLLDPPNVKGWPGGLRWLRSTTLLLRQKGLRRAIDHDAVVARVERGGLAALLAGRDPDTRDDLRHLDDDQLAALTEAVLLPIDAVQASAPTDAPVRVLESILLDPAYQLT